MFKCHSRENGNPYSNILEILKLSMDSQFTSFLGMTISIFFIIYDYALIENYKKKNNI